MEKQIQTLARAYIEAVANKDHVALAGLLTPDVTFQGPVMKLAGLPAVIESLQRIAAVHVGSEVRKVFVDAEEACVIYDFVTDTVGSVPTIEWLRFDGERIAAVQLYYDQLPWQTLRKTLAERAAQVS